MGDVPIASLLDPEPGPLIPRRAYSLHSLAAAYLGLMRNLITERYSQPREPGVYGEGWY